MAIADRRSDRDQRLVRLDEPPHAFAEALGRDIFRHGQAEAMAEAVEQLVPVYSHLAAQRSDGESVAESVINDGGRCVDGIKVAIGETQPDERCHALVVEQIVDGQDQQIVRARRNLRRAQRVRQAAFEDVVGRVEQVVREAVGAIDQFGVLGIAMVSAERQVVECDVGDRGDMFGRAANRDPAELGAGGDRLDGAGPRRKAEKTS